jgi:hypothetical protein
MRVIGLDIHRAFAEAVAWDDGKLERLGRIDMRRPLLEAFAKKLSKEDAFGPSAASATRFTSIWPIVGSAGSDWMAGFPTTRPSRRTDTAAFARATCCGAFSRAWCSAVSPRAWLAPTGLRSTPA